MPLFAKIRRMIRSIKGDLALEIFLSASPFNRSSMGGINFFGLDKKTTRGFPLPAWKFLGSVFDWGGGNTWNHLCGARNRDLASIEGKTEETRKAKKRLIEMRKWKQRRKAQN
jgi:hypothetical protein